MEITEQLAAMMEFDHVVYVDRTGTAMHDSGEMIAPELRIEIDDDGQQVAYPEGETIIEQATAQGWTLLSGYTGQYGYNGPVMHSSETISGGLAEDILKQRGWYVAVAVECEGPDPEGDYPPAGWAIAFKGPTNAG